MGKQHSKTNPASAWVWICRLLVGLLFIFSGLIKANDPLGFSYKLQEYFEVFHITFLDGLALYIAVILCAFEMILGFALLIGVRGKQVAWGLLLLIIFFAFLTFYSAFFKVVQTCGCFGDAIVLTPWQSFSKDLVLLLLILVLFKHRASIQPIFSPKTSDRLLIIAVIGGFAVGFYTYNFLPVMDFLPYKIGANIPDEMKRPPNAQPDVYEQTYHLKNKSTGATKVMNDKEYISSNIWKDNNWQIVGQPESRLVKKGFTPKIQDLSIYDSQHNDYTNELLTNPYYSLVIVAWDIDHANVDAINQINALALDLRENFNTRIVLLTSSTASVAEAYSKQHRLVFELFYADEVPLKEMVRANPGVILLKNGTVINKWHYHLLPKYDDLVKQYFRKQ
ncbi:MAG: BT_3928 family protein [Mucilaginibacter sp.]